MTEETKGAEETADASPQPAVPTEPEGFWCLVANVQRKRICVKADELGSEYVTDGTKAFPPGRKLYVAKPFSGDGWYRCLVMGIDRSGKWRILVTRHSYLENFRPACEYSPSIRRRIFGTVWEGRRLEGLFVFSDKQDAQGWATTGNEWAEKKGVNDILKAYDVNYRNVIGIDHSSS